MPNNHIQFKLENTERLKNRSSSISLQAKTDLERYHHLLDSHLQTVNRMNYFSFQDLCLIADACNGTRWEPLTIKLLHAEVSDAIALDGLDKKWNTDGERLVNNLKSMHILELFALIDAIERWWAVPDQTISIESFQAVGLQAVSDPFRYEDA